MIYGIWYSFFCLKLPSNCPIDLRSKDLREVPLFTKRDLEIKVRFFHSHSRLSSFLQIIFERFTVDIERYIHKFDTHSPIKRGYWSVFLIREIEPLKLKYFKALGFDKYYIVHKMSHLARLANQVRSSSISFLDNSLELFAIRKDEFEKHVTEYMDTFTRKKNLVYMFNKEMNK